MDSETIKNQTFSSGLLGYNKAEVDAYLAELAQHHEALARDISEHASGPSEQELRNQIAQLRKELEDATQRQAAEILAYEKELAALREQIQDAEGESEPDEGPEEEVPEVDDFGPSYELFKNNSPFSMRVMTELLLQHGWDELSVPSLAILKNSLEEASEALLTARGDLYQRLNFEDWEEAQKLFLVMEYSMWTRSPYVARFAEKISSPEVGMSLDDQLKHYLLISIMNLIMGIAADNLNETEFNEIAAVDARTWDQFADFEHAQTVFSYDVVKAKLPVTIELYNMMLNAATDSEEDVSLDTLHPMAIIESGLESMVTSILSNHGEDNQFDFLPLDEPLARRLNDEARDLYGSILSAYIISNYRVDHNLSFIDVTKRLYQHLVYTALVAKAYDGIKNTDEEIDTEARQNLLEAFENGSFSINYNNHAGEDMEMQVSGSFVAELGMSMGLSFPDFPGLVDQEFQAADGAERSEFPELDQAGKEALVDEVNAYLQKFQDDSNYRPMKDKALGKNPNERQMKLLYWEIMGYLNGVDMPILTKTVDFREKVTSYVLMKIKVTMRRDDPLRSPLRSLDNKLYSTRRKEGEPMSDAYYAEVAEFVDTNYPEYSDLLIR
jgi:DivIVA domain-containing protein